MGRKIVLTGVTLTDTTAPRLATVDPIESDGSLLLIEPMHPTQQWAAGVPATGGTVPNLLNAARSTGTTAPVTIAAGFSGTKGMLERSTLGGLHGIVSQAVSLTSGDGAKIGLPAALITYVNDNPTHDYYVSVWDRLTRANPTPASYTFDYATGNSTNNGLVHGGETTWYRNNVATTMIGQRALGNAVGPRFGNAAVDASNTLWTNDITMPGWGVPASSLNNAFIATRNGKWHSFVFYRLYIEDLTASGRTYATVDAIDYALYTQHVLTAGGRYYGDTTPTDPATIP